MEPASDILRTATLLDQVRAGDQAAAARLFDAYQPRLEAYVRGRIPTSHWIAHETLDAVQEVWLRAMASLERFEPSGVGAFWGWLRTIARHFVRDTHRRMSIRPVVGSLDATGAAQPQSQGSPSDEAMSLEEAERFEAAIERLDSRVREAVLLRLELGLGFREIAEACGYPTSDAARMAVTRATRELATILARTP